MSAQTWLTSFAETITGGAPENIGRLFLEGGFWRDYLPFGGTLQTLEGRAEIGTFGARHGPEAGLRDVVFEGDLDASEGFFRFTVTSGQGRGYLRMSDGLCETLFTQLETLADSRPKHSNANAPFVLVVGGGQGGLALGAQLNDLGVPYLIVDKHPRVGDQWRSRYDSLVLHDPVWYDHLPFKPFPEGWPVFTPKDQMGDWLEAYADDLDLDIWTNTALTSAQYDEARGTWTAQLNQGGEPITLHPTHIVMALGLSGFPNLPDFPGKDDFAGPQMHSSAFKLDHQFTGQDVVIVGANNSAHDIAADLFSIGARPTLVQRSSSLVVRQEDYCERVLVDRSTLPRRSRRGLQRTKPTSCKLLCRCAFWKTVTRRSGTKSAKIKRTITSA